VTDARPLRLIRRFRIPSRDHARAKPTPCACPDDPHAFCWYVSCRCDHGFGAQ
jgi:hypothetical protein